ncbi:hypothetical protein KVG95_09615 [Pseudomonas sp. SWRI79]|uniref:Uncharacterized protein n=1 Tax=Pseudomonas farris TaxID=2841207 RepID=A0ABS6PT00_9PSED|nr:hypothetical protein [Pseudomonas farris]MBV4463593.1 hypothetical protein [Pseudomonas farris]
MEETLSSIFARTKGTPINFNGQTVVAIIEIKITKPRTVFSIRRLRATNGRVQGLVLKAANGQLVVDSSGTGYPEIVLWSDTSPDVAEIEVLSKSGSTLKIWNVWKSTFGMSAWVGNAGMHVCETGNKMMLECSDGVGDVDFSDYVVTLEEQQYR